jgi:hypothetical protein
MTDSKEDFRDRSTARILPKGRENRVNAWIRAASQRQPTASMINDALPIRFPRRSAAGGVIPNAFDQRSCGIRSKHGDPDGLGLQIQRNGIACVVEPRLGAPMSDAGRESASAELPSLEKWKFSTGLSKALQQISPLGFRWPIRSRIIAQKIGRCRIDTPALFRSAHG